MLDVSDNPFRPGTGELPPILAGRTSVRREFEERLEATSEGEVRPTAMQIVGPRGCGKTALLAWMKREARGKVHIVSLSKAELASVPELGLALAGLLPKPSGETAVGASLDVETSELVSMLFKAKVSGEAKRAIGDSFVVSTLVRRCLDKVAKELGPLFVLVDEAHDIPLDVARVFYDCWQIVATERPMQLVIAGTPDLHGKLARCGSTFVERFLDHRIGRLRREHSTAALKDAFETAGVAFPAKALNAVLDDAQDYPYFLQLWGKALWNSVSDKGAKRITPALAESARPAFESVRSGLYESRYGEMKKSGTLAPLAELSLEAKRDGKISNAKFDYAAESLLAAKSVASLPLAEEAILHTGFVWKPDSANWEFGIPSLANYLTARIVEDYAESLTRSVPREALGVIARELTPPRSTGCESDLMELLTSSMPIPASDAGNFLDRLQESGILLPTKGEHTLELRTPLLLARVAARIAES